MSKLSVLDTDSFNFHRYISSLTSSASDLECEFLSIKKDLVRMFCVASKLSDRDVLDCVQLMYLYMQDISSELGELNHRLSSLSSLSSG
ncbi:hypothetical protein XFPR_12850 [Xylella fastidiosa]|uniref:hypothetical protein n=1 Tax=Xylella fastidiosa TaxID=2371 RepID=UPI00094F955A|nr:hypothetical protein [Xylella fastidiosa]QPB72919.1 hypothetical protein XFPR_12850 [Xylella fastidiosa]